MNEQEEIVILYDYYGELCKVHPGTCLIAMSDERGKRDEG